jgi:hypothetical protein
MDAGKDTNYKMLEKPRNLVLLLCSLRKSGKRGFFSDRHACDKVKHKAREHVPQELKETAVHASAIFGKTWGLHGGK